MSTSYYYLADPMTSLRAEKLGAHIHLTVWVNHANAGTLVLREEEARKIISLLSDHEADDYHCPIHTHFGGSERGCIVTENVRGLDPALCLVSESGELTTVAAVRALAGGGKRT